MSAAATVLLVESDPGTHAVIRHILSQHGFGVLAVYTPEQALAAVARQTPCAALISLSHREGDGFELVRSLRRRLPPTAPIAMISHRLRRSDEDRATVAGADTLFSLPFDERSVLAWLSARAVSC